MELNNFNLQGLSDEEVLLSRKKFGTNNLELVTENSFLALIKEILKEPMVLLLLVASSLYFFTGHIGDGIFLAVAILLIGAISIYQDSRSKKALTQLKKLAQPNCQVIRNGKLQQIKSEAIVIGDLLMVEEGSTITADGTIIHSNDFSVNESILTGESLSVYKNAGQGTTGQPNVNENIPDSVALQLDDTSSKIFSGTAVASGLAVAKVTAIGKQTELGKIGLHLEKINTEKTPLEVQIGSFVSKMIIAGVIVFIIVWGINYLNTRDVLDSLLKALTLAMSILPEEIPVAFTTFMAMGAWRMMKIGVIVKKIKTVETLGSATVICVDKTGTITKNEMSLASIYDWRTKAFIQPQQFIPEAVKPLLRIAMFASEPIPFDPMEIALHDAYEKTFDSDERPHYKMIHEYPLGGKPPMMTHIFENKKSERIIACKGAPEAIMAVSELTAAEKKEIHQALNDLAEQGFRILGIAATNFKSDIFPKRQQDFKFNFLGLIAFYDPPKENINSVFQSFYEAGIKVKIITGDNETTTAAIANQINFKGADKTMSGAALVKLSDQELQPKIEKMEIFTRMFPEAKLRIINLLKRNEEIVAMTGDGVNDAPALKSAHIGVAMGKKGTEIAKDSSDLVLVDDDLSKMVEAVAMGRKIYTNLKKAIRYIISIHIPIIFVVFIPLALGWIYPNIFTPVHVILLELIMGPTCSIIYENEPMEADTMKRKPRPYSDTFFSTKELFTSIVQGLVITLGALFIYQFAVLNGASQAITRTMVFTTLIAANVFLTLVNRSFYFSVLTTLKYKNPLVPLIIFITIILMVLMLWIPPFTQFFKFERTSLSNLGWSVTVGIISVIWYELVKWGRRLG